MRRVIGLALDGSTVTIAVGRTQVPCISAEYGDNLATEVLRRMGEQIIAGRTPGQYETEEGKIKLSANDFRSYLMPLVQVDGMGNERLVIVVSFYHPDCGGDSDALVNVRFVGIKEAIEASAKAIEVELKMVYDQVYWTDQRITINQRNLAVPLGASKF